MKKVDGLRTVQALVQHHPEVLKPKLHEVCVVLIEEVLSMLSFVQPCFYLTHFHLLSCIDVCECSSLD